ncbi:MAG: hypothetical protein CVV23_11130 [Ignavibacteriae bacterium HGW-Ignavibacteriae-2]|jgi:signal transduction histidine kinase|nr:MAG: hypothetical protein CVV23_11130 [Ignavibacteriae bacterium HGW-Ignavibacteriae-2]
MKNKFLTAFLLLFSSLLISGQEHKAKIDSVNSIPYEYIVSNIYKSIEIFSLNAKEAERIGYKLGAAKSYSQLGKAFYLNGKYDASALNYIKSINLFEELNDEKGLVDAYGEFGYQLKRRDMVRANLFMRKGLHLAEKNKYDSLIVSLYDNYGVLKEMENKLDSADYFYKKSLSSKENMKDTIGIPYSLNKLAGIESMKYNFIAALDYLKRSDVFRKKEIGDFGRAENYAAYGDVYKRMNLIDSAIISFKRCLSLSGKNGINFLIRYSYEQLTDLYKKKGDYREAYKNLEMLSLHKDSVLNKEVNLNIAQLEINYESEKKDHDIAVAKLELSKKNSLLYLLTALASVLGTAFFATYKYQKKKREKERIELEYRGKLMSAEMEKKMGDEKLRISRELHDNIGSQLTFVISSLDNIIYVEKNNPFTEKLKSLALSGRETLEDLRNTIWAIRKKEGDLSQIIYKINDLIYKMNLMTPTISFNNQTDQEYNLTSTQLLNSYRIIQEAIQNALKHSEASEIIIEFKSGIDELIITIKDNGKGFDVNEIYEGSGLDNIRHRCNEASGQSKIESGPGGTLITCAFKVK